LKEQFGSDLREGRTMYTRAEINLDDRLEIFSRYWRFGDDYGMVSRLAEEFRFTTALWKVKQKPGASFDARLWLMLEFSFGISLNAGGA